jgi:signal peptidase I
MKAVRVVAVLLLAVLAAAAIVLSPFGRLATAVVGFVRPSPTPRHAHSLRALRRRRRREAMRQLRPFRRAAVAVALLALSAVAALVVAIGAQVATGHWKMQSIESNSMRPLFARGTVVILASEPASSLRVGQVVAYVPPHPYPQVIVVHQVRSVVRGGGGVVRFTTKGQANPVADPWTAVVSGEVWVMRYHVPWIGMLSFAVGDPPFMVGLGLLLVACVVAIWPSLDGAEEQGVEPCAA